MTFAQLWSWGIIAVVILMAAGGMLYILVKTFRPEWLEIDDAPAETPAITSSVTGNILRGEPLASPVAQTATSGVAPIAMAHNASNEALQIAETAKLETIAALIAESRRKRFHDGEVPETRALEAVFGVKPSSEPTSNYQRLRLLLKNELARLNPPPTQPIYRPLDDQHRPALKDEPVETA